MIQTIDASELAKSCYLSYAKHVNGRRAIPDSRDGLKIVQRRVLATLMLQASTGEHKSPAIIGRCQEHYHPHGEQSIYDALVKMANDRVKWIIGHGNMGRRTLLETFNAAAMRYTSVELNEQEITPIRKLIDFSDFYLNEDDENEPVAIPTIFPYALLSGATGIGVGTATNIPPFNRDDLRNAALALFRGKTPGVIEPECLGGGHIEIQEDQLLSLNQTGKGWAWACAEWEWIDDEATSQRVIRVTDVPDYVNLSKLHILLRDHINDGAVFIRDDTQKGSKNLEVVVGRTKRVKRITDEDIEKVVKKVCRRKITWNCVFSRNGIAQAMTPVQVLEDAINYGSKCHGKWITHEIERLENEITFERVKGELSRLIQEDVSEAKIVSTLKISRDQYKLFSSRSIARLRSAKKETKEIEKTVAALKADLKNPKRAYAKSLGFRL